MDMIAAPPIKACHQTVLHRIARRNENDGNSVGAGFGGSFCRRSADCCNHSDVALHQIGDGRPRVSVPSPARSDNRAIALAIWNEARDPRGTLVERYLAERRGLRLPDEIAGDVIRFHPALFFEGALVAGMVALFRDIRTDEPCGIHRVFLDGGGRKIERRMLGRAKDAAIKLDADDNVSLGLAVGEGIETCLAGWHLGLRPVWAIGSADAIKQFPVLPGIEAITVLGELNDGGANYGASRACAARWMKAGKEAFRATPFKGDDLNTVYSEINHHGD